MEAHAAAVENPFRAAEERFGWVVRLLDADERIRMTHDKLESFVQRVGNEVLRLLLQGRRFAR
jgi:hypothetical protein